MITERKFTRKEYYVAFMNERSFGVSPFLKTTSSSLCVVPHGTGNFNLLLRSVAEPYPESGALVSPGYTNLLKNFFNLVIFLVVKNKLKILKKLFKKKI
jgi:hypothetical protein